MTTVPANPIPAPERIVIRGVNWLGDAVMTTPAITRLRERFPQAFISIFTAAKLAPLYEQNTAVNEIVSFETNERLRSVVRKLRQMRADLALVFPNSPRSAIEAWLARVPTRVGYSRSWASWFLTSAVPLRPERVPTRKRSAAEARRLRVKRSVRQSWPSSSHQVHEYLRLVGSLGGNEKTLAPSITVSREEIRVAVEKFGLSGPIPGARPMFGLNPNAEYGPAKRWPNERFVQAAAQVSTRVDCVWLLFGAKGDVQGCASIDAKLRAAGVTVFDLSGKTSLRELCALMQLCRVVLSNDTGPMHLAAAVGTPVVVPFGSTAPELTGPGVPGNTRHHLLFGQAGCAPCFRRVCPVDFECMKSIKADQAVRAVLAAAVGT